MTSLRRIEQRLWKISNPSYWNRFLRGFLAVFRIINNSQIKLIASSLTYSTLLAVVPLLAVLFTLLKSFGIDKFLQNILTEILAPMGDTGQDVSKYLLQFVGNAQNGLLGGVGLLFLFYSIFTLFKKIEVSLNHVWHIYILHSFKKRLISYLGALMMIVVVATLVIASNMIFHQKITSINFNNPYLLTLLEWGKILLSIIIISLLLAAIYSSVINTKVGFRAAFFGGLFCTVLWIPLTAGFAALIASSYNYSVIYSSFAGMIILLIWLHILWLLFLSGGLVAYFFQYPALLRTYGSKNLNPAEQEYFANILLNIIIDNFKHKKGPIALSQLIKRTGLNHQQVSGLLEPFILENLIINVGLTTNTYLLATDRKKMSDNFIRDIIRGKVRGNLKIENNRS